jgi:hypothetical protein
MDQPAGKPAADGQGHDGQGANSAVPPKQAYKMNQVVPPGMPPGMQQAMMTADGGYQILALPFLPQGMGAADWQNQMMLAQAQTILSIPGLGPVQVDPAALAAAGVAAEQGGAPGGRRAASPRASCRAAAAAAPAPCPPARLKVPPIAGPRTARGP